MKGVLTIFLLSSCFYLFAEKLSFDIDYLGFNVATVEMSISIDEHETIFDNNSNFKIMVYSKSSRFIDFFTHSYENLYTVYSDAHLRPLKYIKDIKQKNFLEKAETLYSFEEHEAIYFESISDREHNYMILDDTKDFFSALYYIRSLNLKEDINFSIDVAGKIVLVSCQYIKSESLRTNIGTFQTNKVELTFKWYDNVRKMRSDILTNNLWQQENKLNFWFTNDKNQIPVKAQYVMKPFNVNWNIKGYKE